MRVPPAQRVALTALARREAAHSDRVLEVIEGMPPYLPAAELARRVAEATDLSPAEADGLVRASLSLATQTKYHGWSAEEIAKGVAASSDLELDQTDRATVEPYLQRLVAAEAIRSTARAVDLQTDHERLYHDARVLTDIRPVFGGNPDEAPTGAVVNEVLKLEYWEGNEFKHVYVALDRNDLVQLKKVIDRAITKTDALRATLDSAGLFHFELEGPSR